MLVYSAIMKFVARGQTFTDFIPSIPARSPPGCGSVSAVRCHHRAPRRFVLFLVLGPARDSFQAPEERTHLAQHICLVGSKNVVLRASKLHYVRLGHALPKVVYEPFMPV